MKEKIIIVDLDSTVAIPTNRSYYEWELVGQDLPIEHTINIVKDNMDRGIKVIILTGRAVGYPSKKGENRPPDQRGRIETEKWVRYHIGSVEAVLMRNTGDYRKSVVTKEDLLTQHVLPHYEVYFAMDDDDKVCDMYNGYGIQTLKVSDKIK